MRVLIGASVLVCCVVLAAARLEDWRSDQALFTAAVAVTPRFPEPAFQLGFTYFRQGAWWDAYASTIRAAIFSEARPDPPHFRWQPDWRTRVRGQLLLIDVFEPVCDSPAARPWCAS